MDGVMDGELMEAKKEEGIRKGTSLFAEWFPYYYKGI